MITNILFIGHDRNFASRLMEVINDQYQFVVADEIQNITFVPPDLIIFDLSLGLSNPFSDIEELSKKNKFKTIPVIFLTSLKSHEKIKNKISTYFPFCFFEDYDIFKVAEKIKHLN